MFNSDLKKEALKALKRAAEKYQKHYEKALQDITTLQNTREDSVIILENLERYITELSHKPKDYETTISEISARRQNFNDKLAQLRNESENVDSSTGQTIGAGIVAGAGVAALAPSAAMAVAMTFGTASTGVAISALSGAAATNAALAWLGGGALAAGGAGMAGGTALLALANPVGLAIGGLAILGGGFWASSKNKKIAHKAEKSTKAIKKEYHRIKETDLVVVALNSETVALNSRINSLLNRFTNRRMTNYDKFTESDKDDLRVLMNSAETLSKKIGVTVQ